MNSDEELARALARSAASKVGNAVGRAIVRGVLGSLGGRSAQSPPKPLAPHARHAAKKQDKNALNPKVFDLAKEAHDLFEKTKCDFLRQCAAFPADDVTGPPLTPDFSTKVFDHYLTSILCQIAYADASINDREAAVINYVVGNAHDVAYYNRLAANEVARKHISEFFDLAIRVCTREQLNQTSECRLDADPITVLVEKLGQAILAADDTVNASELSALAQITTLARSRAVAIKNTLDTQRQAQGLPVSTRSHDNRQSEQVRVELKDNLDQCMHQLHSLIGLSSVKHEVETLVNLAKVFAIRKEKGLPIPDISFHLVFSGNPGTGKTSVARIISKVYGHLKLLSKGHLIEVDRSGLVGNYVGQTATKVKSVIDSAKGGILFIDEAYALAGGSENDFGHEAIDTLLKAMEDYREDLVVIVAGYSDKMEGFLASNPGLRSRFPRVVTFPDYSADELAEIFGRTAQGAQYLLTDDAKAMVAKEMTRRWNERAKDFANARDVRNLFERVVSMQANRISSSGSVSDEDLTSINETDLRSALLP